jgi:hypothetical protein
MPLAKPCRCAARTILVHVNQHRGPGRGHTHAGRNVHKVPGAVVDEQPGRHVAGEVQVQVTIQVNCVHPHTAQEQQHPRTATTLGPLQAIKVLRGDGGGWGLEGGVGGVEWEGWSGRGCGCHVWRRLRAPRTVAKRGTVREHRGVTQAPGRRDVYAAEISGGDAQNQAVGATAEQGGSKRQRRGKSRGGRKATPRTRFANRLQHINMPYDIQHTQHRCSVHPPPIRETVQPAVSVHWAKAMGMTEQVGRGGGWWGGGVHKQPR